MARQFRVQASRTAPIASNTTGKKIHVELRYKWKCLFSFILWQKLPTHKASNRLSYLRLSSLSFSRSHFRERVPGTAVVYTVRLRLRIRNARSCCRRLSVCLSVRQTRALWQNKRKFCWHSYTVWKESSSSFSTRRMVGRGRPLLPEILGYTEPTASKTAISNRNSLVWRLSPYT